MNSKQVKIQLIIVCLDRGRFRQNISHIMSENKLYIMHSVEVVVREGTAEDSFYTVCVGPHGEMCQ